MVWWLMHWSRIEIKDLAVAGVVLTLAYTLYQFGWSGLLEPFLLIVMALLVGSAFILHELGHKWMAQRFGAWSEFRANYQMLGIMMLLAAIPGLGIFIAAPGAVWTHGHLRTDQHGRIALAGPVVNIMLVIAFFVGSSVFGLPFLVAGASINAYLAVFNLIPVAPFDGHAISQWSWGVWGASMTVAGVFMLAVMFVA